MEKKKIIRMEAMVEFEGPIGVLNAKRFFVTLFILLSDGSRFFIFDHRPEVISFAKKFYMNEIGKLVKIFNQPAIVEVIERAGKQSINLYPTKNKKPETLLSVINFRTAASIKSNFSFWNLINERHEENMSIKEQVESSSSGEKTLISLTNNCHGITFVVDSDFKYFPKARTFFIGTDIKPGLPKSISPTN